MAGVVSGRVAGGWRASLGPWDGLCWKWVSFCSNSLRPHMHSADHVSHLLRSLVLEHAAGPSGLLSHKHLLNPNYTANHITHRGAKFK